jgi:conjugative transposon TraN protein
MMISRRKPAINHTIHNLKTSVFMKKLSATIAIILSVTGLSAWAQKTLVASHAIEPSLLAITFSKTTNLVFPYAIQSVDRGSKDVLVQKAKDVDNILQVKAASRDFKQTNLTIITTDGKLYSYLVDYSDNPAVLNITYAVNKKGLKDAILSTAPLNEAQLHADATAIAAEEKATLQGIKDKSFGMLLRLEAWFIRDEVMYCRLRLTNSSSISYRIDQHRFFITDQKKPKRTATQELELTPICAQGDTSVVPGKAEQVLVFALPKFTIPDKRYLAIQVMEASGGRHLTLRVHNKTILKAKALD